MADKLWNEQKNVDKFKKLSIKFSAKKEGCYEEE